jgi:hypothetical protein
MAGSRCWGRRSSASIRGSHYRAKRSGACVPSPTCTRRGAISRPRLSASETNSPPRPHRHHPSHPSSSSATSARRAISVGVVLMPMLLKQCRRRGCFWAAPSEAAARCARGGSVGADGGPHILGQHVLLHSPHCGEVLVPACRQPPRGRRSVVTVFWYVCLACRNSWIGPTQPCGATAPPTSTKRIGAQCLTRLD